MNFRLFYHSLISDWNHGNAHFLRGYARELIERGHHVRVFEPREGWSLTHLRAQHGMAPTADFLRIFPRLRSSFYDAATLNVDLALAGADVVVVHEWTDPGLVARLTAHRRRVGGYLLVFHDTHHRALTEARAMARVDFDAFDAILVYGDALRALYRERGWGRRVYVWHEAADTPLFSPGREGADEARPLKGDLVWIGNWGDDQRADELMEFMVEPVRALGLKACVHGVRYPQHALRTLQSAGIEYRGWVPNFRVPEVFARFRATVHVPRRPYQALLSGIPTIRMFEALACGIPLVSAPWEDSEGLFAPGDFLVAQDGAQMRAHLRALLEDPAGAESQAERGRATVLARHTCRHRVDALLQLCERLTPQGIGAAAARGQGGSTRRIVAGPEVQP